MVIQCAAGKKGNAGHFMSKDRRKIMFVADPARAPENPSIIYRRPDDPESSGRSYRDMVVEYNRDHRVENPFGLLPAWKLYRNVVYRNLAEAFGVDNLFVLSAGWGLIAADFLTPNYDITFSGNARGESTYKRRSMLDQGYKDCSEISKDTSSHVVFFGGKDYVPLFCATTTGIASRTVFYNSDTPPEAPGCCLQRYETATRTNWHYQCAREFIERGGDV